MMLSATELKPADIILLLEHAYRAVAEKEQEINDLNVFPVPDGDTGTNMLLTLKAVIDAIHDVRPGSLQEIADTCTRAALLGARGNSGVILSQIIKGFMMDWKDKEVLTPRDIIKSFENARNIAYRAVNKPVEGTILTVLKDAAEAARKFRRRRNLTFEQLSEAVLQESLASLQRTPELLPVLREAGVVDAGGYGLVIIFEAVHSALTGKKAISVDTGKKAVITDSAVEEITYTFCTEILLRSSSIDTEAAENFLNRLGDSVLVINEDGIVKIHVHTDVPVEVLSHFSRFGEIVDIKVNNMRLQTEEKKREKTPQKEVGIVAVCQGDGLKEIFSSLGVDVLVDGGQTMNPSSEEILKAIENTGARKVIVLPNNKNIVLAAEQAATIADCEVFIVPTKSVQQGIQSLLAYNPERSVEENVRVMNDSINDVISISITRAVRDSSINGLHIRAGNYIGLADGEIIAAGSSLKDVLLNTLQHCGAADASFITIFTGADLPEQEAGEIKEVIENRYPDIDYEIKYGGQPYYPLLAAIEK